MKHEWFLPRSSRHIPENVSGLECGRIFHGKMIFVNMVIELSHASS